MQVQAFAVKASMKLIADADIFLKAFKDFRPWADHGKDLMDMFAGTLEGQDLAQRSSSLSSLQISMD